MPDATTPSESPQEFDPAPSLPLDRDLYCLTCGYNLRGLSGDPVRCPECGNLNPIGDVELPASIIAAQLRRMETAPAICVGAVITGAPIELLFWWSVANSGAEPCSGTLAFLIPLAWTIGVIHFQESCAGRPGWLGALLWYHLWGLLLIVGAVGGFIFLMWAVVEYGRHIYGSRSSSELLALAIVAVLHLLGLLFWAPRLYRLAKAPLLPLQREVAVKIAREQIRARMTHQKRGLLG